MASLSTCHLGLWLGSQILLNLVKSISSSVSVVQCRPYRPNDVDKIERRQRRTTNYKLIPDVQFWRNFLVCYCNDSGCQNIVFQLLLLSTVVYNMYVYRPTIVYGSTLGSMTIVSLRFV